MMPAWLERLIGETTFFAACGAHEDRRKNEKNVFCLSCCLTICPHCLPSHSSHPLLQVRRYVYHDVVRLDDLQKLIDCSYIQPYTINGAKVIFLKERAQSRMIYKGSPNICFACERILQDPFHFCSLSCKVNHMDYVGEDLSCILHRFDVSDFTLAQFEGLGMDNSEVEDETTVQASESTILEHSFQLRTTSSCSSNPTGNPGISQDRNVVRRRKKANNFITFREEETQQLLFFSSSRRKGAPHRSPLS